MHSPESTSLKAAGKRKVLHRAELEHETQVLVDKTQAVVPRVRDRGGIERLAIEPRPRAGVRVVEPRQDLHQRRLARPVLPNESMDLVRPNLERNVTEGLCATKRLRQSLNPENRILRHRLRGQSSRCRCG